METVAASPKSRRSKLNDAVGRDFDFGFAGFAGTTNTTRTKSKTMRTTKRCCPNVSLRACDVPTIATYRSELDRFCRRNPNLRYSFDNLKFVRDQAQAQDEFRYRFLCSLTRNHRPERAKRRRFELSPVFLSPRFTLKYSGTLEQS